MPKTKFLEPIFVKSFPKNNLSIAQQAVYKASLEANVLFVMWARQIGKSNMLSYIWWKRIIDESIRGQLYITMSPTEGDIRDLMIDDILLEAFGGKDLIYDINAIYLTAPEKWWNEMFVVKDPKGINKQNWIENNWLIEVDGEYYVKLFIEDLSNSGGGKKSQLHYTGKVFTGADIMCVAANHNLNKTVRGRKIKGVYGEEMGEYRTDPFGPILPSVIGQNGWMIYAGTPSETNPLNWVYDKYQEVIDSPYVEKRKAFGIDWYRSILTIEVSEDINDIINDNEAKEEEIITQTTLWTIGDLERVFPYVYKGNEKFARIQAQRKTPFKAVLLRDEFGNPLLNENREYKFEFVAKDPNPTGLFTDEKYNREYRVRFDASDRKMFSDFSKTANVIPSADFKWEQYNCITGYDHGVKDTKIMPTMSGDTTQRDLIQSASCYVKIACIPIINTNTFQYVIFDAKYITNPTSEEISKEWHELLKTGFPIIADNAIWSSRTRGESSPFNNIINVNPLLKEDYRAVTGRGIFKCYKREWNEKKVSYNDWFSKDSFTPMNREVVIEYPHPLNFRTKGRKIFITENCFDLIKYFEYQTLSINSKGQLEPTTARDDMYDAATYAIDVMEYKPETVKAIKTYWQNYKNWGEDSQQGYTGMTMQDFSNYHFQQRYGGTRNW